MSTKKAKGSKKTNAAPEAPKPDIDTPQVRLAPAQNSINDVSYEIITSDEFQNSQAPSDDPKKYHRTAFAALKKHEARLESGISDFVGFFDDDDDDDDEWGRGDEGGFGFGYGYGNAMGMGMYGHKKKSKVVFDQTTLDHLTHTKSLQIFKSLHDIENMHSAVMKQAAELKTKIDEDEDDEDDEEEIVDGGVEDKKSDGNDSNNNNNNNNNDVDEKISDENNEKNKEKNEKKLLIQEEELKLEKSKKELNELLSVQTSLPTISQDLLDQQKLLIARQFANTQAKLNMKKNKKKQQVKAKRIAILKASLPNVDFDNPDVLDRYMATTIWSDISSVSSEEATSDVEIEKSEKTDDEKKSGNKILNEFSKNQIFDALLAEKRSSEEEDDESNRDEIRTDINSIVSSEQDDGDDVDDVVDDDDSDMPALDEDDSDMPSLDNTDDESGENNKTPKNIKKNNADWLHNIAINDHNETTLVTRNHQVIEKELRDIKEEFEKAKLDTQNQSQDLSESTDNSHLLITGKSTIDAPEWDMMSDSSLFDFRTNAIPPGCNIIGSARYERENDGSTTLTLDPGSYLELSPGFLQFHLDRGYFTVSMDVYFEKLPEQLTTLISTDITRDNQSDLLLKRGGIISLPGLEASDVPLTAGNWQKITMGYDPRGYSSSQRAILVVNNRQGFCLPSMGITQKFLEEKLYIFGGSKPTAMNRTVKIRTVSIQAKMLDSKNLVVPDFSGSFSKWEKELADHNYRMHSAMSLAPLYKQPPPAWRHPLLSGLIDASEISGAENLLSPETTYLYSLLLTQTSDTQIDMFPSVLPPRLVDENGNVLVDKSYKNQFLSAPDNITYCQKIYSNIATIFMDATSLVKNHPSQNRSATGTLFINKVINTIESLTIGDTTIIPLIICHQVHRFNSKKDPETHQVQVFIVVEITSQTTVSLTLINTSLLQGVKYQGMSAAGQQDGAAMHYKPCISAFDIPLAHVTSHATWFTLLHTLYTEAALSIDMVYYKLLSILFDQPWEQVLFDAQQREIEFVHLQLKVEEQMTKFNAPNPITQTPDNNDRDDEYSYHQQVLVDSHGAVVTPKTFRRFADCEYYPVLGQGSTTQLLTIATEFLMKRAGVPSPKPLILAMKLRILDMFLNDLSYVNVVNPSEKTQIEMALRAVALTTTHCIDTVYASHGVQLTHINQQEGLKAIKKLEKALEKSNISLESGLSTDNDGNDNSHRLVEMFTQQQETQGKSILTSRQLFIIYRGICRLEKELSSQKISTFSNSRQPTLLLDDSGFSKSTQYSLFPNADRFILDNNHQTFLDNLGTEGFVSFDALNLPQSINSYRELIYTLRNVISVCVSLRVQRAFVKNSDLLARSYLFHVFTQLIPVPISAYSPARLSVLRKKRLHQMHQHAFEKNKELAAEQETFYRQYEGTFLEKEVKEKKSKKVDENNDNDNGNNNHNNNNTAQNVSQKKVAEIFSSDLLNTNHSKDELDSIDFGEIEAIINPSKTLQQKLENKIEKDQSVDEKPIESTILTSEEEQIDDSFYFQKYTHSQQLDLISLLNKLANILVVLYSTEIIVPTNGYPANLNDANAIYAGNAKYNYETQVVMGVIFTILDFILHKSPADQRSQVVDTINHGSYGFELGHYIVATQGLLFKLPELAICRAKVIEYFSYSEPHYKKKLLTFSNDLLGPEYTQLYATLQTLTGATSSMLGTNLMEWARGAVHFKFQEVRQVLQAVLIFRCVQTNPVGMFSFSNRQHSQNASPTWDNVSYSPEMNVYQSGQAIIVAVGGSELPQVSKNKPKYISYTSAEFVLNEFLYKNYLNFASNSEKKNYRPVEIKNEDDILHCKTLPSFDNSLSQQDSEQLLSYLTVPYLRLPLITSFFASEDRCHALRDPTLRSIFESILFEQGNLVPFSDAYLPQQVPTEDPKLIGTQYGLLFNELIHNPQLIIDNLIKIFHSSLELDVGLHSPNTHIILYVSRILAQVENYVEWLLDYNKEMEDKPEDSDIVTKPRRFKLYRPHTLHGLTLTKQQYDVLKLAATSLSNCTQNAVLTKLSGWSSQLFLELHMKLKQREYAYHIARKHLDQAQDALDEHEEQDRSANAKSSKRSVSYDEDEYDDDGNSIIQVSAERKEKIHRNEQLLKARQFNTFDDLAVKTRLKGTIGGTASYNLHTSYGHERKAKEAVAHNNEAITYAFEDNRLRAVNTLKRKRATLPSLYDDVRSSSLVTSSDEHNEADYKLSVNDGVHFTEGIAFSCLIHQHLLLILRNSDITPLIATNILASQLYLSTHNNFNLICPIKSDHVYEVLHRHRRQFVSIIDNMRQEALNHVMEKILKVSTCIAPLETKQLIWYLYQQITLDPAATNLQEPTLDDLPKDHVLFPTIKSFVENDQSLRHSLSGAMTPLPHDMPNGSKMVREFGLLPGSRGRYVGMMDSVVLNSQEYLEYYRQIPLDVYSTAIECEINLQTLNITIRNSQMENIPPAIVDSRAYTSVFNHRSMHGALLESNSQLQLWRVIGTEYNLIKYTLSDAKEFYPAVVSGRIYNTTNLHKNEFWSLSLFEPFRLMYLNNPFDPVVILLPETNISPTADCLRLQVCKPQGMVPVMEILLFRSRKLIHAYEYIIYNLKTYCSLIYSSNYYYSHHRLHMSTDPRYDMYAEWERHQTPFRLPAKPTQHPVVVTRSKGEVENLAGTQETLMIDHVLRGIIPGSLINSYLFWQDTDGNLRGYPRPSTHLTDGQKEELLVNYQDYVIFCQLISVDNVNVFGEKGATFHITKVPMAEMRTRLKLKLMRFSQMGLHKSSIGKNASLNSQSLSQNSSSQSLEDDLFGDGNLLTADKSIFDTIEGLDNERKIQEEENDDDIIINIPQTLAHERHSQNLSKGKPEFFDTKIYQKKDGENKKGENKKGEDNSDQNNNTIYELINILNAPKVSASYQIASVLTRLETCADLLTWQPYNYDNINQLSLNGAQIIPHTHDAYFNQDESLTNQLVKYAKDEEVEQSGDNDDVDILDLDLFHKRNEISSKLIPYEIEIPTLHIGFKSQFNNHNEIQLYSIDHNDLYISNIRSPQLDTLMKGIPHGLLFQTLHNDIQILVPTFRADRVYIQSAPYSTEVVVSRGAEYLLESLPYVMYPVHTSHSFCFLPSLTAALQLLHLRWLARDYEVVVQLLDSIGSDTPYNSEQLQLYHDLATYQHDMSNPDAAALMLRLTLVTQHAVQEQPWSVHKIAMLYSAYGMNKFASNSTKLRLSDELTLLRMLITEDLIQLILPVLAKPDMHFSIGIAALYNRLSYLCSLIYSLPSYKVILPPTNLRIPSYTTTLLPSAQHFISWYMKSYKEFPDVSEIPHFTILEPGAAALIQRQQKLREQERQTSAFDGFKNPRRNKKEETKKEVDDDDFKFGIITISPTTTTAEDELNALIPLNIRCELPQTSEFKYTLDTSVKCEATLLGSKLTPYSTTSVISSHFGKTLVRKTGSGFLICYMLLTDDISCKLNSVGKQQHAQKFAQIMASLASDMTHKNPLNFILQVMIQKPELLPLFPKFGEYVKLVQEKERQKLTSTLSAKQKQEQYRQEKADHRQNRDEYSSSAAKKSAVVFVPIAPFILSVARVIVRLFIMNPDFVQIAPKIDLLQCRLQQSAQNIPISIPTAASMVYAKERERFDQMQNFDKNNNKHNIAQNNEFLTISPDHKKSQINTVTISKAYNRGVYSDSIINRESVVPVLTDTDCKLRLSLDFEIFLKNTKKVQALEKLASQLSQLKETELTQYKKSTGLDQLQAQPMTTLDIKDFFVEVSRQEKSLPPISDILPFDLSSHPTSQTTIASKLLNRLESDVKLYSKQANSNSDLLFSHLSNHSKVKDMLKNPFGTEMTTALTSLTKLSDMLVVLRNNDIKFISLGQNIVTLVVNNVGLPTEYQELVHKMYPIDYSCFTPSRLPPLTPPPVQKLESIDENDEKMDQNDQNDEKFDDSSDDDSIDSDDEEFYYDSGADYNKPISLYEDDDEVTSRLYFLLSRTSGREGLISFSYLVGALVSSRSVFDLLKLNPYIPQDYLTIIFSLVELILLRTNRISQINRTLLEVSDLQTSLLKQRSQFKANQTIGMNYDIICTGLLQKSTGLISSLTAKRHYYKEASAEFLRMIKKVLLSDEAVAKVWKISLETQNGAINDSNSSGLLTYDKNTEKQHANKYAKKTRGKIRSTTAANILVTEHLSRIVDMAIVERDMEILLESDRVVNYTDIVTELRGGKVNKRRANKPKTKAERIERRKKRLKKEAQRKKKEEQLLSQKLSEAALKDEDEGEVRKQALQRSKLQARLRKINTALLLDPSLRPTGNKHHLPPHQLSEPNPMQTIPFSLKRHLTKQLLHDPLNPTQPHHLKASCPLRDKLTFLLKASQKRNEQYIRQNFERVQAGQRIDLGAQSTPIGDDGLGVLGDVGQISLKGNKFDDFQNDDDNDQDDAHNPLWDVLYDTPEHVPVSLKQARQGRYGISIYARTGLSLKMLKQVEKALKGIENGAKKIMFFDPRYLVFEFTWSLLLRKSQIEMVDDIVERVAQGESLVKGLIMGAGKTTVIGPLLALMLSTSRENSDAQLLTKAIHQSEGTIAPQNYSQPHSQLTQNGVKLGALGQDKLVVSVVPPALLEFSRSIMRSTFSSVIFKKVITFQFERTSEPTYQMLQKLKTAAKERSIVISTPTAIKSVMLKLLETQYAIANPDTSHKEPQAEQQLSILTEMLMLFRRSYALFDEVDMTMHALRSELNFPFGEKETLDLSPLRWTIQEHMLQPIHYFEDKVLPQNYKHSKRAHSILSSLTSTLEYGFQQCYLQSTPHLVLLNEDFYISDIRAHFIDWALLFLDSQHISLPYNSIRLFFTKTTAELAKHETDELFQLVVLINSLPESSVRILIFLRDFIRSYLPHVLTKINRVHYGILSPRDITLALTADPFMPATRQFLAIPFIGINSPSPSSEFSHPDIVIALTSLSYKRSGLRYSDFVRVIDYLRTNMMKELGAYSKRPSNIRYIEWVTGSGGIVLGSGQTKSEVEVNTQLASILHPQLELGTQSSNFEYNIFGTNNTTNIDIYQIPQKDEQIEPRLLKLNTSVFGGGGDDTELMQTVVIANPTKGDNDRPEVISLRLLKQTNHRELDLLYNLWKHYSPVIDFYLSTLIFPTYMRHQNTKLSASGVDLGSNLIFSRRIGFSGTPSDLIPLDLGECHYEVGSDGNILTTLTSTNIVNIVNIKSGWSVESILNYIANARTPEGDLVYHVFIDTAALITGMSNEKVASYLLKNGLENHVDGVVFLDSQDRKMVLLKANNRIVPLDQCGIPPTRRFAFYDQIHTTGIDISHRSHAKAAITIGKDTVFRDFAQGAYRMRGINTHGQTLDIILTPEIASLMNRTLSPVESGIGNHLDDIDSADSPRVIDYNAPIDHSTTKLLAPLNKILASRSITSPEVVKQYQQLARINAFLIVNSMASERTQFCQLSIQNCTNVWKQSSFQKLLHRSTSYFTSSRFPSVSETRAKIANIKHEKTVAEFERAEVVQHAETKQKKHTKGAYLMTIKRYDDKVKRAAKLRLRREKQEELYRYFDNCMSLFGLFLTKQMKDIKNFKNPKDCVNETISGLREFLLLARKQHQENLQDDLDDEENYDDEDKKKKKNDGEGDDGDDDDDEDNEDEDKEDEVKKELKRLEKEAEKIKRNETLPASKKRDYEFEKLMQVFHEKLDFDIPIQIPKFITFYDSVKQRIDDNSHLITTPYQFELCNRVLEQLKSTSREIEEYSLNTEMVQTMEDEKVKEEEKDQEKMVEIEKAVETVYDRQNEAPVSWPFNVLAEDIDETQVQFYHADNFGVLHLKSSLNELTTTNAIKNLNKFDGQKGNQSNTDDTTGTDEKNQKNIISIGGNGRLTINFPKQFYLSNNYYNQLYTGTARRLKNITMYLDLIPSLSGLRKWTQSDPGIVTKNLSPEDLSILGQFSHELKIIIKFLILLGLCPKDRHHLPQKDHLFKYQNLANFLTTPWDELELTIDNINDLIYILTNRLNNFSLFSTQTSNNVGDQTCLTNESHSDPTLDVSTLSQSAPIDTELTLNVAALFQTTLTNSPTQTIKAADFLTLFSTSLLFPGELNRNTVAISLAEAETIRRIVHFRVETNIQKKLYHRRKIVTLTEKFQHRPKLLSYVLNRIPEPVLDHNVIPGKDTAFALRCVPFGGVSVATTHGYTQPLWSQFNSSLQLLRFMNNDTYFTPPQVTTLVTMLDGNYSSPIFSTEEYKHHNLSEHQKNLTEYYTSLLAARRRFQSRWIETPVKVVLSSPSRFELFKNNIFGRLLHHFMVSTDYPAYDFFTWMDVNIDNVVSPAEFYQSLFKIIDFIWNRQICGDNSDKNNQHIDLEQNKKTQKLFQNFQSFVTHQDIIQLFFSVLPINTVMNNINLESQAKSSKSDLPVTKNNTYDLSQQPFTLSFKDFSTLLQVNSEEEMENEAQVANSTPTTPGTTEASIIRLSEQTDVMSDEKFKTLLATINCQNNAVVTLQKLQIINKSTADIKQEVLDGLMINADKKDEGEGKEDDEKTDENGEENKEDGDKKSENDDEKNQDGENNDEDDNDEDDDSSEVKVVVEPSVDNIVTPTTTTTTIEVKIETESPIVDEKGQVDDEDHVDDDEGEDEDNDDTEAIEKIIETFGEGEDMFDGEGEDLLDSFLQSTLEGEGDEELHEDIRVDENISRKKSKKEPQENDDDEDDYDEDYYDEDEDEDEEPLEDINPQSRELDSLPDALKLDLAKDYLRDIRANAHQTHYYHPELAATVFNFTTPQLPPGVELIGTGRFVPSKDNIEDGYWEIDPFSALVVTNPKEAYKPAGKVSKWTGADETLPSTTQYSAVSVELWFEVPQIRGDTCYYPQTPQSTSTALRTKIMTVKTDLSRFIYCYEKGVEIGFTVESGDIDDVVDDYLFNGYVNYEANLKQSEGIIGPIDHKSDHKSENKDDKQDNKGVDNDDENVELPPYTQPSTPPSAWPLYLTRAIIHYAEMLKLLKIAKIGEEAVRCATSKDIYSHPTLVSHLKSSQHIFQLIAKTFTTTNNSVLGDFEKHYLTAGERYFALADQHTRNTADLLRNMTRFFTLTSTYSLNRYYNQFTTGYALKGVEMFTQRGYSSPTVNIFAEKFALFGGADVAICQKACKVRSIVFWDQWTERVQSTSIKLYSKAALQQYLPLQMEKIEDSLIEDPHFLGELTTFEEMAKIEQEKQKNGEQDKSQDKPEDKLVKSENVDSVEISGLMRLTQQKVELEAMMQQELLAQQRARMETEGKSQCF